MANAADDIRLIVEQVLKSYDMQALLGGSPAAALSSVPLGSGVFADIDSAVAAAAVAQRELAALPLEIRRRMIARDASGGNGGQRVPVRRGRCGDGSGQCAGQEAEDRPCRAEDSRGGRRGAVRIFRRAWADTHRARSLRGDRRHHTRHQSPGHDHEQLDWHDLRRQFGRVQRASGSKERVLPPGGDSQ